MAGHGVQVFDLSRLRTMSRGNNKGDVPIVEPDSVLREVGSTHNLVAFPELDKIIGVGLDNRGLRDEDVLCPSGSLAIWDVSGSNALQPVFEDCHYTPGIGLVVEGYVHDGHCIEYHGPDTEFAGRHICALFAEKEVVMFDFNDRSIISTFTYPTAAYVHQGWFSEDHTILYTDDELDEEAGYARSQGEPLFFKDLIDTAPFESLEDGFSQTYVFDVSDLSSIGPAISIFESSNTHPSIDHNLYLHNGYLYHANYNAGVRIRRDIGNGQLEEVGFFDFENTCETLDGSCDVYGGAWTHFPYYESGLTTASHQFVGVFIMHPTLD